LRLLFRQLRHNQLRHSPLLRRLLRPRQPFHRRLRWPPSRSRRNLPPPYPPRRSWPAAVVPSAAAEPHAAIRAALKAGQLAEAERLLEAGRESAKGLALAELTGLAGDHAAAAGRQSHAKWLWRLAIKRFGEEGAMDTPAARAISESLRVTG
jgi:hypothetical protein